MGKLRKLWRLPFSYKWLLLITVLLLAIVRLGLWLLPCRHWLRLSQHPLPLPSPTFFHLRQAPSWSRQNLSHPSLPNQTMSNQPHTNSVAPQAQQEIALLNWSIRVASQLLPGQVKCLARALTMHQLMVWYGYDPSLRIGVARNAEGAFAAHAWITYDGIVAIGNLPDLERYTPLPNLQNLQNSPL